MRQDECKAAAYALMAFANMPYGNFRDISLRDVLRKSLHNLRIDFLIHGKNALLIITRKQHAHRLVLPLGETVI